jgi:hypothetical protein
MSQTFALTKSQLNAEYEVIMKAKRVYKEKNMGSLSIRGIDEELGVLLKEAASLEHKSVNQFVLETIKKQLGLQKPKQFTQDYHDLDSLFGKWSEDEFLRIEEKINNERRIDAELWK